MELPAYLAFSFVSAGEAATPGPSTLLIVNNALTHGWRRALGAVSGDLAAIALLATLSVIGLGALLVAHPVAFLALRLAGARLCRPSSKSPGRQETMLEGRVDG